MAVQRLGDVAVGTVVKVKESGKQAEFIVIQQGSPSSAYVGFDNGTVLHRKTIHSEGTYGSNNSYSSSELHSWGNGPYLNSIDENIRNEILPVKIPYRPGSGYGSSVYSGNNGLSCKVFSLSAVEFNDTGIGAPPEGAAMEYFKTGGDARRQRGGKWWSRSPVTDRDYDNYAHYVYEQGFVNGSAGANRSTYSHGRCPAFVLPQSLYVQDDGTIITNAPPTAPGSITADNVIGNQQATITLTAATDPDGTVESYIYERQVDGGAWQQVAQANSLTQTDTISADWGTVAYRACAVDDLGVSGPYVTGETQTINSGWVTIGGPAETMGSKPAPFDFAFSVSVSGQSSTGAITVSAALDGKQVYSGTPNAETQISVPIDTRLLGAGEHTIEVQASKDDYLPASKRYTFTVPAVVLPDGGVGALAQGPDGRAVYHTTLAQRCIGTDGVDIQAQVDALTARVKTLEG